MSSLRTQLLGAIAAGLALGCKSEAAPAAHPVPPREAPAIDAAPAVDAAPAPIAPPTATAGGCSANAHRETYCLAVGQGAPKQVVIGKPKLDANGCADPADVTDACNGVEAVLSGPVVAGKQCCFEVCKSMPAPCGRLLLDAYDNPVVANVTTRARPWSDELPEAVRAKWLLDARLEHASVAAFARFSLELMALGAPGTLIADAHRAALDELEHARLCFALASPGGSELGPAELSLDNVRIRHDVAEIVRSAADECCVGETFAALVATRALATSSHEGVRRALTRIAADEAKHAELGWRFVAWAVARFGESALRAAEQGLERGSRRLSALELLHLDALETFGCLSDESMREVVRDAREELIAPLGRSLGGRAVC